MWADSSTFVKHIPCQKCGSKDNSALYSDGHTYCFGCGHRTNPDRKLFIQPTNVESSRVNTDYRGRSLDTPIDSTKNLPDFCYQWLYKYNLTSQEIDELDVYWSEYTGLLIFPMKKDGVLSGYVGRRFKGEGSKYMVKGEKRTFSVPMGSGETIVFTEDLISAKIVSRVTTSCCLFGTSVSKELVSRLASSSKYNRYLIWLDKDKRSEALRQALYFKQFGYNFGVIMSEKDPKDCSMDFIKKEVSK